MPVGGFLARLGADATGPLSTKSNLYLTGSRFSSKSPCKLRQVARSLDRT